MRAPPLKAVQKLEYTIFLWPFDRSCVRALKLNQLKVPEYTQILHGNRSLLEELQHVLLRDREGNCKL